MIENSRVVLSLIEALLNEWEALYSVEEIACDEQKVTLMIAAHTQVSAGELIPESVRKIYREVFLRDIWDRSTPS